MKSKKRWAPIITRKNGNEFYFNKSANPSWMVNIFRWNDSGYYWGWAFDEVSKYPTLGINSPIKTYATKKAAVKHTAAFLDKSKNYNTSYHDEKDIQRIAHGWNNFIANNSIRFEEVELLEGGVTFDSYTAKSARLITVPAGKNGVKKCYACGVKLRDIPYVTTSTKPSNICIPCLHEAAADIKYLYDNMPKEQKDALDAGKFMHKI